MHLSPRRPHNAGEVLEIEGRFSVAGQFPGRRRRWFIFRWDSLSGSWVTDTRKSYRSKEEAEDILYLALGLAPIVERSA